MLALTLPDASLARVLVQVLLSQMLPHMQFFWNPDVERCDTAPDLAGVAPARLVMRVDPQHCMPEPQCIAWPGLSAAWPTLSQPYQPSTQQCRPSTQYHRSSTRHDLPSSSAHHMTDPEPTMADP
eukprot:2776384-Rhodomonas_salina.1